MKGLNVMKNWKEYRDDAVDFAVPYVKQAGEYAGAAAEAVNQRYKRNKRKIKRSICIAKFSRVLGIISKIAVLAAAITIISSALRQWFDEYRN